MVFINGCDIGSETEVEVKNISSYDLHIKFTSKESEYNEIDIIKDESGLIILTDGLNRPRNPNDEVEKITFYNLDNNEFIIEINKNKNLFKETYFNMKSDPQRAKYLLEITDELLF
jgi:hypothetical protein